MYKKHNKNLTPLSQVLRKNMTKEERRLWYDFLRSFPVRFKRQKVIGNYIVDFYCFSAALVIELDGSQHYETEKRIKDEERTKFLNSLGIKVIRISNLDINSNFTGVCEFIENTVKERIITLPPSPTVPLP